MECKVITIVDSAAAKENCETDFFGMAAAFIDKLIIDNSLERWPSG